MSPKNLSGKKEECPLEWRWATFCREVHVRLDEPNEVSLIGVTNGFDVNILTGPLAPPEEQLYPVGLTFWVHANFRFKDSARDNVSHKVSALVQPPNAGSFVKEIDVLKAEGKKFASINLQLNMREVGSSLLLREGENILRVLFRYKTVAGHKDLGASEISINTHVDVSENPQFFSMPGASPSSSAEHIKTEDA